MTEACEQLSQFASILVDNMEATNKYYTPKWYPDCSLVLGERNIHLMGNRPDWLMT